MYSLLLIVVLLSLIAGYYAFIKQLTYWKNKGVQQDSPYLILKKNLLAFVQLRPCADVFQDSYRSSPNARGVYLFLNKFLMIRDVNLIKTITIKNFDHFANHRVNSPDEPLWERNLFSLKDEKWKKMRTILSPSFTSSKMKMMFNLMVECGDNLINYFEKQTQTKSCVTIEMKDVSTRFANDVIASTAFGYNCYSLTNSNNEFYLMGQEILPQTGLWKNLQMTFLFSFPALAKIFGFRFLPQRASNYFSSLISQTLKDRGKTGIVRYDMLHLMMEARKDSEMELSDLDITAQAIIFFFAGFKSVSTLISFMAYELAINVDIQKRLQNEIDQSLENWNGKITYDSLFKMKYLDMVVSETLRKWPSSAAVHRVCSKPYQILPETAEETTLCLVPGDAVLIPIHALQNDPKLFPNPERFDPERFSEENKAILNNDAYMPFGSGPRSCIANRFALMEAKVFFFKLLSKFDIVVVEKTPIPMKLTNVSFQLKAKDEFWVGLTPRDK